MRLLGLVISVGLADSMNPSTIAPALYLATGENAKRDLAQFILGAGGIYLIGGLLIVLGPGEALLALVPHPHAEVRYILETIAGVVVLTGGLVLWHRRHRLSEKEMPAPKSGGRSAFVLGLSIMVLELPTALPYFAVIAAVVGSGLGAASQVLLVVIYNVCFVLPLLAMLATVLFAGDSAGPLLARGREFLQRRWPVLLAVLAIVAGVFVTVLGVTGLLGNGHGTAGQVSRRLRRLITHG